MEYFFKPLFSIVVEHGYFADGLWHDLSFIPTAETELTMERNGVLIRQTGSGVAAFYDELLRGRLPDDGTALEFGFKVYAQDRRLSNYTLPTVHRDGAVLAFGNRSENEGNRLSVGEFAGEDDFRSSEELVAQGVLNARDCRVPPDFVVIIRAVIGGEVVPDYRVRFEARRSYWKYHLLGNMNREGPYIVDLDSRIEFKSLGEVVLPDNRKSRVFLSTERIPVQEKSNYRFQLRERSNSTAKVLIRRLPVASEARLGREIINGSNEIVLENYVNF